MDSILSQGAKKDYYDIVVVDDGSTDKSPLILDEYARKYDNVSVYHIKNHGVSYARNVGLLNSTGLFVSFVDGDDKIISNSLEVALSILNEVKSIDIIYVNTFIDCQGVIKRGRSKPANIEYDKSYVINEIGAFCNGGDVWGAFYKRSFIIENNISFIEGIANSEDAIFNYTLYSFSPSIAFYDIDWYSFTVRAGSASRSASIERARRYRKNIDYLKKKVNENKDNGLRRELFCAALYQSISDATNMFIECGVVHSVTPYHDLGISNIPFLKTRFLNKSQRIKLFILNISYTVYYIGVKLNKRINRN